MTTAQASAWLAARGVHLQPNTIKRHILRGNLRAVKPGRDWEISAAELKRFMDTRQTRPGPRPGPRPGRPRPRQEGPTDEH